MTDLAALTARNAARWATARIQRPGAFQAIARHLVAPDAKVRYQAVAAKTGVPWAVIAVIHEREASQDFDTHLAQGDPLGKPTVHVPKGEPAFATWEEGALDALVNCEPHAARWTDWSIGGALTLLTLYNGLGPENHGIASGYVWAGTDQYTKGKYVRDGIWDPNAIDQQLGCAGLLRTMMALDPSIRFAGATPQPAPSTAPAPAPAPKLPPPPSPAPAPPQGGWFASLIAAIFALFKK
jgi:lysozyme family protein